MITPDMKSVMNSVQIYGTQNGAWKGAQDPYAMVDSGVTQWEYISTQYITKLASIHKIFMEQYQIMKTRRQQAKG